MRGIRLAQNNMNFIFFSLVLFYLLLHLIDLQTTVTGWALGHREQNYWITQDNIFNIKIAATVLSPALLAALYFLSSDELTRGISFGAMFTLNIVYIAAVVNNYLVIMTGAV
jgi:hypothetical protein